MIIFKTTLNVLPEKHLEITQTLLSMLEPTGKEQGCVSFTVYCDILEKSRFLLVGEWETREDLNKHIESNRFGVLLGSKALLCKPIEFCFYVVSTTEGMETVNSARKNFANKRGSKFGSTLEL